MLNNAEKNSVYGLVDGIENGVTRNPDLHRDNLFRNLPDEENPGIDSADI